jgi:hypothetical protein
LRGLAQPDRRADSIALAVALAVSHAAAHPAGHALPDSAAYNIADRHPHSTALGSAHAKPHASTDGVPDVLPVLPAVDSEPNRIAVVLSQRRERRANRGADHTQPDRVADELPVAVSVCAADALSNS